tara:strand:+ start:183 stop:785 length:603 start_codon:yes stop_codon:yes gene_type:complete
MAAVFSNKSRKNMAQQIMREKTVLDYLKKQLDREFKDIYGQFINNFNSHPVTREIEGGPRSTNLSGTLGGVGNLFTYIGFSAGSDPIKPLRQLLETYDIRYNIQRDRIQIIIEVATKEQVFLATPLPWAMGRSWARGIERGISGFGEYLVKNTRMSRSKSGFAIQADNKIRGGRFSNTSYMSALLNDYYKKIQQLQNKTL